LAWVIDDPEIFADFGLRTAIFEDFDRHGGDRRQLSRLVRPLTQLQRTIEPRIAPFLRGDQITVGRIGYPAQTFGRMTNPAYSMSIDNL